jgi:hypothetical protein
LSTKQTNDADGSANENWKDVDRLDDAEDADDLYRLGKMTEMPTLLE